jgi:hypothetical protein
MVGYSNFSQPVGGFFFKSQNAAAANKAGLHLHSSSFGCYVNEKRHKIKEKEKKSNAYGSWTYQPCHL